MPFHFEKQGGDATRQAPGSASYALAKGDGAEQSDELLARIRRLTAERRGSHDPEVDRELLALRHRAGLALLERHVDAKYPAPDFDALETGTGVPEVGPTELSPELVRAAILRHGCLLVRGLIDTEEAEHLRDEMDRAFAAREEGDNSSGYFEWFVPDPRYDLGEPTAGWKSHPEALSVADSPRLAAELFDIYEGAAFVRLVSEYLGEHPVVAAKKSTLRRIKPHPDQLPVSLWHQDGAFMGEVRTLDLWLSLSRCGDVAPGLDVVPTRIDHILPTGTEGALFNWSVSHTVAEEAAGAHGISRPIFEPGDALLMDELTVHATALTPEMSKTRYAVERWFFGPSAFPAEYPPLAV
jgi:hypothetical protein